LSQDLWIKSAYFPETPDFLFKENEILVIQLFSPLYTIILIIAFVVVLSFALGRLNVVTIILSFPLAWFTSAIIASKRRKRMLNMPVSKLTELANVKTIDWSRVTKIEVKGRKIAINTTSSSHNSWITGKSITKVSLAIQQHPNVHFRIFRYHLKALAAGVSLLLLSFLLAFAPSLAIVILGFVSLAASAVLFVYFFTQVEEIAR
jgi:hypothetical protein